MSSIHRLTVVCSVWATVLITLAMLAHPADAETVEHAAVRERAWTRLSLLAGYKSANWFAALKEAPADQHRRLLSMADEVYRLDDDGARYVFNVEEKPGTDERFHYTLVLTVKPEDRCHTITDVQVTTPEY